MTPFYGYRNLGNGVDISCKVTKMTQVPSKSRDICLYSGRMIFRDPQGVYRLVFKNIQADTHTIITDILDTLAYGNNPRLWEIKTRHKRSIVWENGVPETIPSWYTLTQKDIYQPRFVYLDRLAQQVFHEADGDPAPDLMDLLVTIVRGYEDLLSLEPLKPERNFGAKAVYEITPEMELRKVFSSRSKSYTGEIPVSRTWVSGTNSADTLLILPEKITWFYREKMVKLLWDISALNDTVEFPHPSLGRDDWHRTCFTYRTPLHIFLYFAGSKQGRKMVDFLEENRGYTLYPPYYYGEDRIRLTSEDKEFLKSRVPKRLWKKMEELEPKGYL